MKKKYYIFTAIISYFVLLVATIPASTISPVINDNTTVLVQGVSGTLWNGKAIKISIDDNISLNNTHWSFSVLRLFIGQISLKIDTRYLNNNISAEVGTSILGEFFINNLTARLPASEVATLANIPLAQIAGELSINIEHAQWKQGGLPIANGQINWSNASITVMETAALGNINITLSESKQQLLNADIKNQGGDISISGTAELVPEANYAVNIRLSPNAGASNNIIQSLNMFAKKQNNGDYLIINSGTLDQIGLL